jgi:hypothetical protein
MMGAKLVRVRNSWLIPCSCTFNTGGGLVEAFAPTDARTKIQMKLPALTADSIIPFIAMVTVTKKLVFQFE